MRKNRLRHHGCCASLIKKVRRTCLRKSFTQSMDCPTGPPSGSSRLLYAADIVCLRLTLLTEARVEALGDFRSSTGGCACGLSFAREVVFVVSPIAYNIGRSPTTASGSPTAACAPSTAARHIAARYKCCFRPPRIVATSSTSMLRRQALSQSSVHPKLANILRDEYWTRAKQDMHDSPELRDATSRAL
jgi:hypothetical protein